MRARPLLILLAITLARVAFGFQMQTPGTLGPTFLTRFGIDYATLGTLIGLYMAPGTIASLPCGMVGRRFGEGLVLAIGMVLMALGYALPLPLGGLHAIGAGRVVAGTGAVVLAVMQGKILADRFRGPRFLVATGLAVGGFPIGVGLCQLLTPALDASLGWWGPFLAGAVIAAVAAVLFVAAYREPPEVVSPRRFGLPSRRECVLVLLAGLTWTTYNTAYFGFLSYAPSVMHVRGHAAGETGLAMTLATWLNIPAILLGGWLAGRIGTRPVFAVAMLALAGSVAGLGLGDRWLLMSLIFGTVGSMQAGLIVAAGTLSARPENRAVGMGIFYTVYYISGTLMPAVCGFAADRFGGPQGALLTASALSLLAFPIFWVHERLLARPVPAVVAA